MAKKRKQSKNIKQPIFGNIFFYFLTFFLLYSLAKVFLDDTAGLDNKSISETVTLIKEGKVQDIVISEDNIEILLQDGTKFVSEKESSISFDDILNNNEVDRSLIAGEVRVEHNLGLNQIIGGLVSFGLPILFLFLIFRQMKGASGDIMSFGKSRAQKFDSGKKNKQKISFKNVAGMEEAKKEMIEIVDFLKNPKKYQSLGARIPKGVLLIGPAGVGKTLLARAIAGEANVPFYSVAGSEFMEMLVGVGSARARDLFKMAKMSQPSLIFIDEIDAIGRQRGMGIGGGHDEREQTLNQILIEMDGFDSRTNVIVLAATNRPDMLDPALIRAGRFDRRISIPLPDLKEREEIVKLHMSGKPFKKDVKVNVIAKKTVGFSGADIENMLNEAAILAARNGYKEIVSKDLEEAALKVTVGSARRMLQTDIERKMTAYHEAGHALVGALMSGTDPVHRVSIVARGGTLGHTSMVPLRDRYNETKSRLLSIISTMLGGRVAEELVFNELTIGASNDIERSTKIARKMVTEYGMSNLGPISYDGNDEAFMLAKQFGNNTPNYSDEVAASIDKEVKRIVYFCYEKAKDSLEKNRAKLDNVAKALVERETLYGDEFYKIADIKPHEEETSLN